MNIREVSTRG